MEAIKLEEIVPSKASFELAKTGKNYRLKAVTLADEMWMNETFGTEISEIFSQIKMKDICRIVFHLMEEEDKEDFAAQEVTIMNEEGEKIKVKLGGAGVLYVMISGYAEKIKIFEALLKTIGISRPVLKKLEGIEQQDSEQKKSPKLKRTGQKSSTLSRTSTAGQPSTSFPVRRGKYRTASRQSSSAKT